MSAPTTSGLSSFFRRVRQWLPTSTTDRRVRVMAWATLAVQIGIVGTGGAVRLTGSGLGCPTWPRCTEDSFVPTPEMGIHGIIEYGNRTLTAVLVIVAILTFLFVVRMREQRRDLFWLSILIGLYVPVQAILGGITVLTHLNPYVVGLHYFASVPLVALAAVFVSRVYQQPGQAGLAVPRWYPVLAWATAAAVLVTVMVGILVTGSGPHAGDKGAARNGLNPALMQHIHSWPAYLMLALSIALVIASWKMPEHLRLRLWTGLLLGVEVVQIFVGIWQARTGLPEILVGIHLLLAVVTVAAMTAVLTHLRTAVAAGGSAQPDRGSQRVANTR